MSDFDQVHLAIERAHTEIAALCKGKFHEGGHEWRMSIPADPERDSDLIISDALIAAEKALAAAEARGRKQAADEIAERLDETYAMTVYGDIARAYAAEQDTGP